MKVQDFIQKYEQLKSKTAKDNLVSKVIKKDVRLPFVQKKTIAENIAKISCTNTKTGEYKVDSIMTAFWFAVTVIENYTTLEFSEHIIDDYEPLDASGLMTELVNAVDEAERNELDLFTKLAVSDLKENRGDTASRLTEWLNTFINGITALFNGLPENERNEIIGMVGEKFNGAN